MFINLISRDGHAKYVILTCVLNVSKLKRQLINILKRLFYILSFYNYLCKNK